MLQEIRDTNNNYVRYVYTKDGGQIYPSAIYYTGNGGTDGIFTISFTTQSRSDNYISYKPQFKVTTNYRISQITAAVNSTVVREYNLSYASGNNGVRSMLSSIQENGYDANHQNEVTLPSMSFSYINSNTQFTAPGSNVSVKNPSYIVGDANGDGSNDVTWFQNNGTSWSGTVVPGGSGSSVPISPAPSDGILSAILFQDSHLVGEVNMHHLVLARARPFANSTSKPVFVGTLITNAAGGRTGGSVAESRNEYVPPDSDVRPGCRAPGDNRNARCAGRFHQLR
jgi:hypothetical protein